MKSLSYTVLILFVIAFSCSKQAKKNDEPKQSHKTKHQKNRPTADNSQTSLDWDGTYKAILPCADCEGIETIIYLNKDLRYIKKLKYLGKEEDFNTSIGVFSWDDQGQVISLDNQKPNAYLVGENQLFALDVNNTRITGDLADQYTLKKLNDKDLMLTTSWTLVKLNQKRLEEKNNQSEKAHIEFIKKDSLAVGSTGCNRFRGHFTLKPQTNQLSFKQLSSTLMACQDMTTESDFLNVLEHTNQYHFKNDNLVFFNDDKTHSASFVIMK